MIYCYCIIDSNRPLVGKIAGLEEAPVYNIPYHEMGLIVSSLKEEIKGITEDRVLIHERVVESLMGNYTVLPIRFHTVFQNREGALSLMRKYCSDFKNNFLRLRNKVEYGIRVIWSGDLVKEGIARKLGEETEQLSIPGNTPAKNFLKDKLKEYRINTKFKEEAEENIALIDNHFQNLAAEKKLEKLKSNDLLLSACYLVEKNRQSQFKKTFEKFKNTHTQLKYLFSGPWPPYNFIELTPDPIHRD